MELSVEDWVSAFSTRLGTAPPTAEETEALLDLAGVAAHASVRTAAPISCWLAARAGVSPGDALILARDLAGEQE